MIDNKYNVLLVDDSEVIHKIVRSFLDEEGYNIFSAYDGKEGLKLVDSEKIDIILSDVNMPFMNGFDMCHELKKGKHKAIPLIFLTSEQKERDIEKGHEVGANDYLAKPFKQRELLFRLQNQVRLANFQNEIKADEKRHQHVAMIATLGHELNNSLTILSAALYKLKSEKVYNRVHIEKIEKSKQHIADIVKKLAQLDPEGISYKEYAEGVDIISFE